MCVCAWNIDVCRGVRVDVSVYNVSIPPNQVFVPSAGIFLSNFQGGGALRFWTFFAKYFGPFEKTSKKGLKISKNLLPSFRIKAADATRRIIVPHTTYQIWDLFRLSKFKGPMPWPP